MKNRVLVGIPLVALMFLVVFTKWQALNAIILLFAIIAQIEMYKSLKNAGYTPTLWTSLIFVLLFYPINMFYGIEGIFLLFAILTGANMCWTIFYPTRKFMDIIMSEFMLAYPAIPFYFIMLIKTTENHIYSALMLGTVMVIASLNDIIALVFGKKFGKHKLSPILSPNKTIEGAIAGVTGSVIIGFIVLMFLRGKFFSEIHWIHLLVSCLISSIFATAGDLIASAIKRFCGIKDYGHIFPGHGGILDRLDSYLLSVVVIYTYFYVFII